MTSSLSHQQRLFWERFGQCRDGGRSFSGTWVLAMISFTNASMSLSPRWTYLSMAPCWTPSLIVLGIALELLRARMIASPGMLLFLRPIIDWSTSSTLASCSSFLRLCVSSSILLFRSWSLSEVVAIFRNVAGELSWARARAMRRRWRRGKEDGGIFSTNGLGPTIIQLFMLGGHLLLIWCHSCFSLSANVKYLEPSKSLILEEEYP